MLLASFSGDLNAETALTGQWLTDLEKQTLLDPQTSGVTFRKGELVVVTDRGVPKALIVAIPGGDQMAIGVEEGWITPPSKSGKLNPPLQFQAVRRSLDVINEDRGE